MSTLQMPTNEHVQFDEICAPVEDFEPLPTVVAPIDEEPPSNKEEPLPNDAPRDLDGLILAGLVTPY
jgi:hypothetical protein